MHFDNEKYLVKYSKFAFHCTELKCSEAWLLPLTVHS